MKRYCRSCRGSRHVLISRCHVHAAAYTRHHISAEISKRISPKMPLPVMFFAMGADTAGGCQMVLHAASVACVRMLLRQWRLVCYAMRIAALFFR